MKFQQYFLSSHRLDKLAACQVKASRAPCRDIPRTTQLASPPRAALAIVLLHVLSACSTVHDIFQIEEVKPWQRGVLASDDMRPVADPMQQGVDDHIYFSKEASTGGGSLEGGGCGCN